MRDSQSRTQRARDRRELVHRSRTKAVISDRLEGSSSELLLKVYEYPRQPVSLLITRLSLFVLTRRRGPQS